ncbi:Hypothetical_protein [Hexamita inflata]|uniref:Hypothetical_protein n=1 Tax=Hexamita inflata TaxID=28002 RepID=A0AA86V6D2_9EUKA|nr:Hypothetical protein HINF_LOCUS65687 [Hexamita inflata]
MQTYYEGDQNNQFLKTLSQDLVKIFQIDKDILDVQPSITFVVPQNMIDNAIIKIQIEESPIYDINLGSFGVRDDIFQYIIDICQIIQYQLLDKQKIVVTYNPLSIKNNQLVQLKFDQPTKMQIQNYWLQKLLGANDEIITSVNFPLADGTNQYRLTFPNKYYQNFIKRINVLCPLLNETTIFENKKDQYNFLRNNLDQPPGTRVCITSGSQSTITTQQLINGISVSFTDENYHEIPLDQKYYIELNVQKNKQRQQIEIEKQQQLQYLQQEIQQKEQEQYQQQQIKQQIMIEGINKNVNQVEQEYLQRQNIQLPEEGAIFFSEKKQQIENEKEKERELVDQLNQQIQENETVLEYYNRRNNLAQKLKQVFGQQDQYITEYMNASNHLKQNPQADEKLAQDQNQLTNAMDGIRQDYNNGTLDIQDVEKYMEDEIIQYQQKQPDFTIDPTQFYNDLFSEYTFEEQEQEQNQNIEKERKVAGLQTYTIKEDPSNTTLFKLNTPDSLQNYFITEYGSVYNQSTGQNIQLYQNNNQEYYFNMKNKQNRMVKIKLDKTIDMEQFNRALEKLNKDGKQTKKVPYIKDRQLQEPTQLQEPQTQQQPQQLQNMQQNINQITEVVKKSPKLKKIIKQMQIK